MKSEKKKKWRGMNTRWEVKEKTINNIRSKKKKQYFLSVDDSSSFGNGVDVVDEDEGVAFVGTETAQLTTL